MNDTELRRELAQELLKCHHESHSVRAQVISVMNVLGKNGYLEGERRMNQL